MNIVQGEMVSYVRHSREHAHAVQQHLTELCLLDTLLGLALTCLHICRRQPTHGPI